MEKIADKIREINYGKIALASALKELVGHQDITDGSTEINGVKFYGTWQEDYWPVWKGKVTAGALSIEVYISVNPDEDFVFVVK